MVEVIRCTVFLTYKLVLSDKLQFDDFLGLTRVLYKVLVSTLFCFLYVSVDFLRLDNRFLVGETHLDSLPEFTLSHYVHRLSSLILPVQERVN